MKKYNNCI